MNSNDSRPSSPPAEEVLHRAFELALEHLESQQERPVAERVSIEDLRRAFSQPLAEAGEDPRRVLDELVTAAEPGLLATTGPRFFGFVIGGSLPVAVAADWLVSAWDQNSGLYSAAPAVSIMEEVTAGWVLSLLGLPLDASVGFVTGCQMAHCTALAAARNGVLAREGWDVETDGLQRAPEIQVVVAAEAHATIFTALRLLGLGSAGAIHVDCDDQGRMVPVALERTLRDCSGPTIVCTQAGNVNSGAFDPLGPLVEIAHRHNAWVHVDGAFGLWAAASPELSGLLEGHHLADSWSTDAHKWPNVPYDCGIAIVADPAAHRRATSVDASYLVKADGAARDPLDWVPEFSRRGRAVPLYAALKNLGSSGVRSMVETCCANARLAAELFDRDDRVVILNEVVLNQVLLRFQVAGRDPEEFTARVISRVLQGGVCWIGSTRWHGEVAVRFSVSNARTTGQDVESSVAAILDAVDQECAEADSHGWR